MLVQPDTHSALISWDANVIGFGQVEYGTAASPTFNFLTDSLNITDHSIQLTGLAPGTTYQFWVRNLHAIEGFTLAEEIGSFTTLSAPVSEPSTLMAWAALATVGIVVSRRRILGTGGGTAR